MSGSNSVYLHLYKDNDTISNINSNMYYHAYTLSGYTIFLRLETISDNYGIFIRPDTCMQNLLQLGKVGILP